MSDPIWQTADQMACLGARIPSRKVAVLHDRSRCKLRYKFEFMSGGLKDWQCIAAHCDAFQRCITSPAVSGGPELFLSAIAFVATILFWGRGIGRVIRKTIL